MSGKDSKTIGKNMEETKEYHQRYLRAINSSVRRKILRTLRESDGSMEALAPVMGMDERTLNWHLSILEYGFCIEKEESEGKTLYRLTKEGEVVDYME